MNREHYEALGYVYTAYRDILRVRSLDLPLTSRVKITAICERCGDARYIDRCDYSDICKRCVAKDPERRAKISAAHVRHSTDPEVRRRKSEAQKRRWTPEKCHEFSVYMKNLLQKPEVRRRYSVKSWARFSGPTNPKFNPTLTVDQRIRERKYPEYTVWRTSVYKRGDYT